VACDLKKKDKNSENGSGTSKNRGMQDSSPTHMLRRGVRQPDENHPYQPIEKLVYEGAPWGGR